MYLYILTYTFNLKNSISLYSRNKSKTHIKIKKELKKGARVISYSFTIDDWKPQKTYLNSDSVWRPIYLCKI